MFMWDESTPITLSTLPTNQLKVSLGVRAATLRTIKIFVKSSCWTSLNTGMVTVRATLPLRFLVLKSGLSGLRTIHTRDNPHKG